MIFIAGPCVIDESTLKIAEALWPILNKYASMHEFYFKASFDKANRSCVNSYRGPGLAAGLKVLKRIKKRYGFKITTDVHELEQVKPVSDVVDMLQIPALLCRQTDLLMACGMAGREVNIKKGQFMAPWDMAAAVEKVEAGGCKERIFITERGTTFGYNRLVVDCLSIPMMKKMGLKTILDCTHSLQLPAAGCGCSASQPREFATTLANVATIAGADGIFCEVYPVPDEAKCDGPNSIIIDDFERMVYNVSCIETLCLR